MLKNIIKDRRLELGLTLEQVGNAVGVNRSTVQRWESGGIGNLKQDKILALANILRVSPSYLLGMTDEKEPKEAEVKVIQQTSHLAVDISDLTEDEQRSVIQYIAFIKANRGLI